MVRTVWMSVMVTLSLCLGACGGNETSSASNESAKKPAQAASKSEILLSPDEQVTASIETTPVESTETPEVLRVSGRIARADNRIWHVGVRTNGLVRTVSITVGDAVRAGQTLARYHADEVREERAKYRTALSELREHEAAAALARKNFERAQRLLDLKAASVQQVDQARLELTAAETEVQNSQIEVDRTKDVLEDDLRVPAEPKPGDEEADSVPILSPGSGFVLEKNVTLGQTIAPGQDAFVIGDLSQVWMLASVRQDALGQLRVGQPVTVTIPGVANQTVVGKIINLGQELDPTTRTMAVRIALDNSSRQLRPEMLASAEIPVGLARSVLEVPSDAVQQINGQDVVFVRSAPDRFTVRPVQVGPTSAGKTPILEGLKAGELVVVSGSFVLKSHLLRASMESE